MMGQPVEPEADRIVERVLKGEVDAYGEIVRLFQRDVWKIAAVALQTREAVGDLVQEIFVEAYFALHRYHLGRDFRAWIRGVARNHVREMLRDRSRESRLLQSYRDLVVERLSSDESAGRHEEEMADAQRRCRQELSPHSLQMLALRYDEDLSYQDIGGRLGKSMESVKQLFFRIHVVLRDCIQKRLARA
jgi:RNA polymerase sigma-70 factor (ECF subfamily)